MATWVLTRGLQTVRYEFDGTFKLRDKRSDGSIGDQAHSTGTSGHNPDRTGRAEYKDGDAKNEVRAIDVDKDLVPGSGIDWMERVVQYIVKRARAGHYVPFRYIIYKRRIWSRSDGWKTRTYTGANAHDQHAHFSGDYTQKADEWTGSLGLASLLPGGSGGNEDDMEVSDLNAALREPKGSLAVISRAIPWQYVGGGIPEGMSTLGVLNAIHGYSKTTVELVKMLAAKDEVDEAALAAALGPAVAGLILPGLVQAVEDNDGTLSVEQITEAVKQGTSAVLREGVGS